MNTAVSVLKRVDIDEPERQHGGSNYGIKTQRRASRVRDHALDQRWQILRPGADMIGQRRSGLAVMLTDEAAVRPQSKLHEARVADDDSLQPQEFIETDGAKTGLPDRASPALNSIHGRAIPLDGVAGL